MRNLKIDELAFVQGANFADDATTFLGFHLASMLSGAAAGHIGGSIFGYKLATFAGAGTVAATLGGAGLGIIGAYAGAYVFFTANGYLYTWARPI